MADAWLASSAITSEICCRNIYANLKIGMPEETATRSADV
jgi:hypothetical protein